MSIVFQQTLRMSKLGIFFTKHFLPVRQFIYYECNTKQNTSVFNHITTRDNRHPENFIQIF